MFSLSWGCDEWPERVQRRCSHVRGSGKISRRPGVLILDRLTAVGAAQPRYGYSLTAIVEHDNPRADGCCTSPENPARLNGFDDGEEAKAVVNRVGNPAVSPGQVADMNVSMPIRHGMFVARFSALAEEHERLARLELLVGVAAKLHPGGRFTLELCYPTRVRPYTLLLQQG